MNKISIAIIVTIIILVGFVVYGSGMLTDPYWEEEFGTADVEGVWRAEIVIYFKDGSSVSAKQKSYIINSIVYQDKEVDRVVYTCMLKITNFNKNIIPIDVSSFELWLLVRGYDDIQKTEKSTLSISNINKDEWYTISEMTLTESFLNSYQGTNVLFLIGPNSCSPNIDVGGCIRLDTGKVKAGIPNINPIEVYLDIY